MTMAIQVLLQAITGPYEAAMGRAAGRTVAFERSVEGSARAGGRFQGAMAGMTGKLVAGGGLLYGLQAGAGLLMSYEDALVGVGKTTGLTGSELEALGDRVAGLGGRLGSSAEEMLNIAQSAAQLGVQTNDIEAFTETIAGMALATDLTTESAATGMARLSNILGRPISEVDALGSTIVALGNSMATTEPEILDMSMRLAAAGRLAGLTDAEVLGLAGTMSSLGLEAEAGGTALSRVLRDITDAAATGNDKLAIFAQTAGTSADEFAAAWQSDPAAAFQQFIDGLGQLSEGEQITTLQALDLDAERVGDALLRAAGGADLLESGFGRANQAMSEGRDLAEEVAAATDTASVAFNAAGEEWRALVRTLAGGGQGSDGLASVARFVGEIATNLNEFVSGDTTFGDATTGLGAIKGGVNDLVAPIAALGRGLATGDWERFDDIWLGIDSGETSLRSLNAQSARYTELAARVQSANTTTGDSYDDLADDVDGARGSLEEYIESQRAAVDPLFAFNRAARGLQDARAAVEDVTARMAEGDATARDYDEAMEGLGQAAFDLVGAASAAEGASGNAADAIRELGAAGILTADEVNHLTGQLGNAEQQAEDFVRDYGDATIGVDVDVSGLDAMESRLSRLLGRRWSVDVDVDQSRGSTSTGGSRSSPTAGTVQFRARGGRTNAWDPYVVGEEGPELFVPDRSGYVMDASRSAALLGAMGRQQPSTSVSQSFSATVVSKGEPTRDAMIELRKLALRIAP